MNLKIDRNKLSLLREDKNPYAMHWDTLSELFIGIGWTAFIASYNINGL